MKHVTAQIRNESRGDQINVLAGTETLTSLGSVYPCDGEIGGTLYMSSPNAWVSWFVSSSQNHITVVDASARTGPASWAAIRVESGCAIRYRVHAVETQIVDQNTGLRTTAPMIREELAARWWYVPGLRSDIPGEVFPIVAGITPQADIGLLPAVTVTDLGYCPRLTRYAMISSALRMNALAVFPGSAVHGQEQISGPNDGDSTFYLGPWSLLQLENNNAAAIPAKIIWTTLPGAHQ